MKTMVFAGLVLAFFSCGLAWAAPGPQFDLPFASLSARPPIAPVPLLSLADLDLLKAHPVPLVPGSPSLLPAQAGRLAKALVLKGYFNKSLKVSSFSFSSPEELVNWLTPQVTFLKDLNTPRYHGPAWQIHFIAPQRPGKPANMTELPGDDFDMLLARDGKDLGVVQAID